MNKKAQTEDIFADLIPSIILIVVGVLILYYFSYNYAEEIGQNGLEIKRVVDRESFSLEGMMNHQIETDGKKYRTIDLVQKYYSEQDKGVKGNYASLISKSAKEYINRVDPEIFSCFKITLSIQLQEDVEMVNLCKYRFAKVGTVKTEKAIIPLTDGSYATIRIEHGEPENVI